MGSQFRSPFPGKNPLFISYHPHWALYGGKIGEIPDLFPNKERTLIAFSIDPLIIFSLEFLTEHPRNDLMHSRHRISSIFGEHHRFFLFLPKIQLDIPSIAGGIQVAA